MNYASLLQRALAQIIDYLVFCIVFFPVTYLVKGTWLMTPEDHLWIIFDPICAVFLVIIFAYYIVLEWLTGYTAGKYILKMRVRTNDGKKITLKQSLIRNFGRMIDGLPCFNIIGIFSIIKSLARQRVGDKLAGTVVVINGGCIKSWDFSWRY
jgi:uncharacterized RDD family membrane protein YckC